MLGNHLIAPVLLATDLAAAREFYHEKPGLQIAREDENGIVFKVRRQHPPGRDQEHGRDRRPADSGSVAGQRHPRRGGRTPRPRRQGRGLRNPGAETEDGIADTGFAWAAWIIDPATNALGILQIKEWPSDERSLPGLHTWPPGSRTCSSGRPASLLDSGRGPRRSNALCCRRCQGSRRVLFAGGSDGGVACVSAV